MFGHILPIVIEFVGNYSCKVIVLKQEVRWVSSSLLNIHTQFPLGQFRRYDSD